MASRKRSISNVADVSTTHEAWNETSCPICMDHPHNAVLLICSSHVKGCRAYICDTSYRHSNCLDRFKKINEDNSDSSSTPTLILHQDPPLDSTTSVDITEDHIPIETGVHGGSNTSWERLEYDETNMESSEKGPKLRCPLCRGMVLGYEVVKEARLFLNLKSRSCSHESCSFSGNYRELRSHARRIHPTVRPADVDPSRQRDWHLLEIQREYNDIVSVFESVLAGAVVFGDYVIDNGDRLSSERGGEGGQWLSTLVLFQMIGSVDTGEDITGGRERVMSRNRRPSRNFSRRRYLWGENLLGMQDDIDEDEEEEGDDESEVNVVSDNDDDVAPNPRRRRRLTWGHRSDDEDEQ